MNLKLAALICVFGFALPLRAESWPFERTNQRGAFTAEAREREPRRIEAFIGRRSAMKDGQRSSLKWLSRLIKQHPKAERYVVEWFVKARGKWWNVAALYDPPHGFRFVAARSSVEAHPPFPDLSWSVSAAQIHRAARRGNTFKVFGKGEEM